MVSNVRTQGRAALFRLPERQGKEEMAEGLVLASRTPILTADDFKSFRPRFIVQQYFDCLNTSIAGGHENAHPMRVCQLGLFKLAPQFRERQGINRRQARFACALGNQQWPAEDVPGTGLSDPALRFRLRLRAIAICQGFKEYMERAEEEFFVGLTDRFLAGFRNAGKTLGYEFPVQQWAFNQDFQGDDVIVLRRDRFSRQRSQPQPIGREKRAIRAGGFNAVRAKRLFQQRFYVLQAPTPRMNCQALPALPGSTCGAPPDDKP